MLVPLLYASDQACKAPHVKIATLVHISASYESQAAISSSLGSLVEASWPLVYKGFLLHSAIPTHA